MISVSGLWIYPVKSLRGISVERWPVDERGLRYDRHWMIIDEAGRFRTQRQLPQMTRISTQLNADELTLSAEGYGTVKIPIGAHEERVEASIWNYVGLAYRVPYADEWLSTVLEMPCRLVAMPEDTIRPAGEGQVAFADAMPILVTGEASLAALNASLDQPVSMDRFRPNVSLVGSPAYAEDEWEGLEMGDVRLNFAKLCGRCLVTTTDQKSGERDAGEEPLRTLVQTRLIQKSACFGAYYTPQVIGELAVGMDVTPSISG